MPIKLDALQAADWVPLFRDRLAAHVPDAHALDYERMFSTGRQRAVRIWNREIVPELDVIQQRAFERELLSVGMRAGLAIPQVFANGFVYGLACSQLAGGDATARHEAAVTCGLYLFILGLFDHLFDEHPQAFAGTGALFTPAALERWTLGRELDAFISEGSVLAQGLVNLYRLYLRRCHRALDRESDPALARLWCDTLCEMHASETRSAERRISKAEASPEIIEDSRCLTESGYRGLALTAALGLGVEPAQRAAAFGAEFGRLSWYVDDVTDLDEDIANDIWNGLAARLVLEAKSKTGIAKVITAAADESGAILERVYTEFGDQCWVPGDDFSLADYMWASLWNWLGGTQTKPIEALSSAVH